MLPLLLGRGLMLEVLLMTEGRTLGDWKSRKDDMKLTVLLIWLIIHYARKLGLRLHTHKLLVIILVLIIILAKSRHHHLLLDHRPRMCRHDE